MAAAFFAAKAAEVAVKWAFAPIPELEVPRQNNVSVLLFEDRPASTAIE